MVNPWKHSTGKTQQITVQGNGILPKSLSKILADCITIPINDPMVIFYFMDVRLINEKFLAAWQMPDPYAIFNLKI